MKSILLFLLLITCLNAKAQSDPVEIAFLNEVMGTSPSVYSSTLNEFTVKKMLTSFERDTVRNNKWNFPDSGIKQLNLTTTEREEITQKIKQLSGFIWKYPPVKNAVLIDSVKVNKIFADNSKGWEYFNKHYGDKLKTISKPIFIRNNTVCFLYRDYSCGRLCAEGSFNIYVKENGEWRLKGELFSWVS